MLEGNSFRQEDSDSPEVFLGAQSILQESCLDKLWWGEKSVWRGKWCCKSTIRNLSGSWERAGPGVIREVLLGSVCSFSTGAEWCSGKQEESLLSRWKAAVKIQKRFPDVLSSNYRLDFFSWWFFFFAASQWELLPPPGPACGLQPLLITRQQELNHLSWALLFRAELWQRLGLELLCVKIRWVCRLQLSVRDQLSCFTWIPFTAFLLERDVQVGCCV